MHQFTAVIGAADLAAGNNLCNSASVTGGFTCPGLDQIGNIKRNTAWGPNFFNSDMSIFKNVSIYERVTAQFRMDAFNALNKINYGNPNGAIDSTSSGSITGGPYPGWARRNHKPPSTAVHIASAVLTGYVARLFCMVFLSLGKERTGKSVHRGPRLKPPSLSGYSVRLFAKRSPQRLKPNSLDSGYVRPKGRTLHRSGYRKSLPRQNAYTFGESTSGLSPYCCSARSCAIACLSSGSGLRRSASSR